MRSNWWECALGDLVRIKHGYAFKGEFFGPAGTHVVLTPGNFHEAGGFKEKADKAKWYSGPVPSEYVLDAGDLIVAMTEQGEGLLGSSALVPKPGFYLHNQRLGLVTPSSSAAADRGFLYYLFNSRSVRQQIRASANGAKIRHTSPTRIYEVKVRVPDVATQRRIASILSAYDDLIENNTRRIALLEEMVRRIYEEWFVRFRFPGHEGVRMVESELGLVPEGWEIEAVEDVIETLGGGTPSKTEPEYWDGGDINWYSPTDLTGARTVFMEESASKITAPGLAKSSAKLFPAKSVMMTSRATLGVIAVNTTPACTNQGFIVCVPSDRMPLWLLFHWLKANESEFEGLATGATFKEITKGVFRKIKLAVPARPTSAAFERVVGPMMDMVLRLERKNRNLRTTRDLLLPKLISGELDVLPVAEPQVETT